MIFFWQWNKAITKLDSIWNNSCLCISHAERLDFNKDFRKRHKIVYNLIHRVYTEKERSRALYNEIINL